jgi:MFS family permease
MKNGAPGFTGSNAAPGTNEKILFVASFLTLIAAGIGFTIRGYLLVDWGQQFGFTQTELGEITGAGLWGFPLAIIPLSFVVDRLGYGRLMTLAFVLYTLSAVVTLAATPMFHAAGKDAAYRCLYFGTLIFSLANGTCESVINPLTATLFPKNKTHWLNILHAGWPGGLVLGAVLGLGFRAIGPVRWEIQLATFLVPTFIYGALMVGRRFPKSETTASGIPLATMFAALLAPMLLFLFMLHALIGYVELGTDTWITNITNTVLASQNKALMAFIWTNVLMFTLRFFAGPIVHKISPLGLLFCSAVLGTIGLLLLGMPMTSTTWAWLGAVTVYGVGKTFYWPTMLGVISERFPKAGALGLGLSAGIGMLAAGLLGSPIIGYQQDLAAVAILGDQSPATLKRYQSDTEQAPLPGLRKVAGLDNGKIGVLDEYEAIRQKEKGSTEFTPAVVQLTLEKDLELLTEEKRTDKVLEKRLEWWQTEGLPYASTDFPEVKGAQLHGGKQALSWTAAVPAVMALGFLLLIIYFRTRGGYKAEVLVGHAAQDEEFTGGTVGPGEG